MSTMSLKVQMKKLIILMSIITSPAFADGVLSDNKRIASSVLDYELQYRVYTPAKTSAASDLPVLYVADGPGYIRQGQMPMVLDALIESGEISPVVVVFVDPRDPDNLRKNRRNQQFLCNGDYLEFYKEELIPTIAEDYPVGQSRDDRGILGLSFGATNAACFGLMGSDTFSDIGMHSPANHPVKELLSTYEEAPMLPLNIFLSTGTPDDNTSANRSFHKILEAKGYPMKYMEVREGHNWKNWKPLIDDVLLYFYGVEK
jgi:enterochelin esterase-like enzyme